MYPMVTVILISLIIFPEDAIHAKKETQPQTNQKQQQQPKNQTEL